MLPFKNALEERLTVLASSGKLSDFFDANQVTAPVKISGSSSVGGGCINQTARIQLNDGTASLFLKWNGEKSSNVFAVEYKGLKAMHEAGAIRIPKPLLYSEGGPSDELPPCLVMEWIASGSPSGDFMRTFGQQFAQMHLNTKHDRFGFDGDNYLGSTLQPNTWSDSWIDFWREHRLGFQLKLARDNGYANASFTKAGDALLNRLDDLIGEPDEPACLLHGDLLGGNYLVSAEGEAVLMDPAVYYGRREADLAMTQLFGGFSNEFYTGYEEVWPLADGAPTRLDIYKLYHLLNHLNLFGRSYYSQCLSILNRFQK
jgi:fructosamine-3-kinase